MTAMLISFPTFSFCKGLLLLFSDVNNTAESSANGFSAVFWLQVMRLAILTERSKTWESVWEAGTPRWRRQVCRVPYLIRVREERGGGHVRLREFARPGHVVAPRAFSPRLARHSRLSVSAAGNGKVFVLSLPAVSLLRATFSPFIHTHGTKMTYRNRQVVSPDNPRSITHHRADASTGDAEPDGESTFELDKSTTVT